jgi:hypothetical protein
MAILGGGINGWGERIKGWRGRIEGRSKAASGAVFCATLAGCSGSEGSQVAPDDSGVVDAVTTGTSAGSGGSGGVSSTGTSSGGSAAGGGGARGSDVTTPPTACTPACLWNLFKDCRVIAPCFDEPLDGGTRSCRPSTGVTWFTDGAGRTVYRSDGSICYTVVFGNPSTWKDATGSIVITIRTISSTDLQAACDGSTFDFHPNTPECQIALGTTEACTMGSCPP